MTEDEVRRVYDLVAEDYARHLPDTAAERPADLALVAAFADLVPAAPSGARSVVDVGCGTGRLFPTLRALGLTVTGIDPSPGMLSVAHRLHPSVPVTRGTVDAVPVADASVGGVLAWYSVIHTAPRALPVVAEEFRRVLVPGGPVLLAFQQGAGPRLIERAYGRDEPLPAHLHDAHHVTAVLAAAGFTVDSSVVRPADGERYPQGFVLARRR